MPFLGSKIPGFSDEKEASSDKIETILVLANDGTIRISVIFGNLAVKIYFTELDIQFCYK